MSRSVRAALTETKNAFAEMPASLERVEELAPKLPAVREANVRHHLELVAAAAGVGVRVLCMGELFTGPYFALHEHPMWRELAEDAAEGPTVAVLREAARRHAMLLIAPIYELDARSGKRFDTAVVIDGRGELLGKYRKTHVPRGANERAAFHETFYYEPSDGDLGPMPANVSRNPYFPVFETEAGRIGVTICYDRHFPGAIESLAAARAEMVFSPAVTFGAMSRRMWELEFEVDAARQRLFLGGSNRSGAEAPWNVEYFGASRFWGPDGRVAPVPAPPRLVVADLDLDALDGPSPSGWNLARDARPGIYSRPDASSAG
jgi:N-carbamoylputrescine amidase